MTNNYRNRSIVFIAIGILCFIFSIACAGFEVGRIERMSVYGGDAFTGIQNAAAQTSENVYYLNKILKTGFTFMFVIAGLGFIGAAIPPSRKDAATVGTGSDATISGYIEDKGTEQDSVSENPEA